MAENHNYNETLSSTKTHVLFVTLTITFLALFLWCLISVGWNGWGITFLCISAFFLFYVFNYRTLKIHITPDTLQLKFGIITLKVAVSNIKNCYLDEDTIWRFGGAGIHFMFIKGKYRSFWNFLEYPRVVVTLRKKKGLVQEIAFTTMQPEQVMEIIRSRLT
jgi:hypothetical protein